MRLNLSQTKVKFYFSIKEAADELELNKKERDNLYRAAKGPRRTFKDYIWKKIDWEVLD